MSEWADWMDVFSQGCQNPVQESYNSARFSVLPGRSVNLEPRRATFPPGRLENLVGIIALMDWIWTTWDKFFI